MVLLAEEVEVHGRSPEVSLHFLHTNETNGLGGNYGWFLSAVYGSKEVDCNRLYLCFKNSIHLIVAYLYIHWNIIMSSHYVICILWIWHIYLYLHRSKNLQTKLYSHPTYIYIYNIYIYIYVSTSKKRTSINTCYLRCAWWSCDPMWNFTFPGWGLNPGTSCVPPSAAMGILIAVGEPWEVLEGGRWDEMWLDYVFSAFFLSNAMCLLFFFMFPSLKIDSNRTLKIDA